MPGKSAPAIVAFAVVGVAGHCLRSTAGRMCNSAAPTTLLLMLRRIGQSALSVSNAERTSTTNSWRPENTSFLRVSSIRMISILSARSTSTGNRRTTLSQIRHPCSRSSRSSSSTRLQTTGQASLPAWTVLQMRIRSNSIFLVSSPVCDGTGAACLGRGRRRCCNRPGNPPRT